ncbi:MAG: condensation domain-containing protein, partial [Nostoc sp.]
GPLLRAVLQELSEIEHILLLTIHEIVGDDWSLGVLLQELATLYEAFSNGLPSPLVELPSQYADFAIWQREYLLTEVLESQLAYWKQQLGGKLPILELPTDRPR